MIEKLEKIKVEALDAISEVNDEVALNNVKSKYVGKKSVFNEIMAGMSALSPEEKKSVGSKSNEVRKDVVDIISNYPDIIQMHGFYVDQKEHTIMFDIILKFETKSPSGTRNEIVDALKENYPEYQITINLDTDFSD